MSEVVTLESEIPVHIDANIQFSPHSNEGVVQLYESLVEDVLAPRGDGNLEANGELQAALADRWEVSADGKTWTFNLRQGVISSHGHELTASMYKEVWEINQARGGVVGFLFGLVGVASVPDDVQAVDDYTLTVTTGNPSPMFLKVLSLAWMGPMDMIERARHVTEEDPQASEFLKKNSIGFGPYRIVRWREAAEIAYDANPTYYGERPQIQEVTVLQVPAPANRLALLLAGRADITRDLTSEQLVRVQETSGLKVTSFAGSDYLGLVMNNDFEPFGNLKVRQAISYAVPYQEIADTVFRGFGERSASFIAPSFPDHAPQFWPYDLDLDKARALLAEAGHPEGFSEMLIVGSANPNHEAMAVILKSSLAKIGIDLTIELLPLSAYTARRRARDMPFFIQQGFPLVMDTGYQVNLVHKSTSGSNAGNFKNAELDALLEESLATVDEATRQRLSLEMQQLVVEQAPWAWLGVPGRHTALKEDLNIAWKPSNYLFYKNVTTN